MADHILRIPYVTTKFQKLKKHGYGKKRALCHHCHELKDNKSFTMVWYWPHPSNSTGYYYEGHTEACCSDCLPKEKEKFMGRREYRRLTREFCERLKKEATDET